MARIVTQGPLRSFRPSFPSFFSFSISRLLLEGVQTSVRFVRKHCLQSLSALGSKDILATGEGVSMVGKTISHCEIIGLGQGGVTVDF